MREALLFLAALALPATAAILPVPAGGNLQSALNSAQPGDTVVLEAGATFTGNFYLPPNPGSTPITVQSSGLGNLPAPGNRVSPNDAGSMAKIVTPNPNPALSMSTGAAHYRLVGLEFHPVTGVYVQDLITAGIASETSNAALPYDIVFERDFIHGDPQAGGKRGLALNSAATDIRDCYFSNFFSSWQDTQAIAGWNGSGPYNIVNNYLEAGTETVAFGAQYRPTKALSRRTFWFEPTHSPGH